VSAIAGTKCVRLRIEGRVQGVGFRAFVEREATAHGLDGWVRNRRDGGVEAVVSGPAEDVDGLTEACRVGPPAGRVDMLKVLDEDTAVAEGFIVLPTV
jgi:acylphosphatase